MPDIGDLTIVNVFPGFGDGGPMMVSAVGGGKEGLPQQTIIDETKLEAIRAMPGVETVITRDGLQAGARLVVGQLEGGGQIAAELASRTAFASLDEAGENAVLQAGTGEPGRIKTFQGIGYLLDVEDAVTEDAAVAIGESGTQPA